MPPLSSRRRRGRARASRPRGPRQPATSRQAAAGAERAHGRQHRAQDEHGAGGQQRRPGQVVDGADEVAQARRRGRRRPGRRPSRGRSGRRGRPRRRRARGRSGPSGAARARACGRATPKAARSGGRAACGVRRRACVRSVFDGGPPAPSPLTRAMPVPCAAWGRWRSPARSSPASARAVRRARPADRPLEPRLRRAGRSARQGDDHRRALEGDRAGERHDDDRLPGAALHAARRAASSRPSRAAGHDAST